jgi:hypothetical protein
MQVADSEGLLGRFLATMRRPRGEVQWTQMIAAVAGADSVFASHFASVLIDASPRREARRRVATVPARLMCTAELVRDSTDGGN